MAGFGSMRALSGSGISRPFDVDRDGFCASEGAGVLVLEEAGHAAARGARVYAEVAGLGSTADGHHITAPSPGGAGALACMRQALADAGVEPSAVTHVNAHGTSTPLNDATEAAVIAELFGPARPAVTAIKGVTGHSLGAAGAIEAVALALSYAHRELPTDRRHGHSGPRLRHRPRARAPRRGSRRRRCPTRSASAASTAPCASCRRSRESPAGVAFRRDRRRRAPAGRPGRPRSPRWPGARWSWPASVFPDAVTTVDDDNIGLGRGTGYKGLVFVVAPHRAHVTLGRLRRGQPARTRPVCSRAPARCTVT